MPNWLFKTIFMVLATFIATFIASIPTLFWLGLRSLGDPSGFLENFFLAGLGMYFLVGIQFIFIILWAVGVKVVLDLK